MNNVSNWDWRGVAVVGGAAVLGFTTISLALIAKLDPSDVKEVVHHVIGAISNRSTPAINDTGATPIS
jgi:hypothetical protein